MKQIARKTTEEKAKSLLHDLSKMKYWYVFAVEVIFHSAVLHIMFLSYINFAAAQKAASRLLYFLWRLCRIGRMLFPYLLSLLLLVFIIRTKR